MCLGIPGQIVAISDEAMQTGIVQVPVLNAKPI